MNLSIIDHLVLKSIEISQETGIPVEELLDYINASRQELNASLKEVAIFQDGEYIPIPDKVKQGLLGDQIMAELSNLGFTATGSPNNPAKFTVLPKRAELQTALASLSNVIDIDPKRAAIVIMSYYDTAEYPSKLSNFLQTGFAINYQAYAPRKSTSNLI